MPRFIRQTMKIYAVDVTSGNIVQEINPHSQISNFQHMTRLPGGFYRMSFRIALNEPLHWEWRLNRLLYRIIYEEQQGRVVFEGRLEDIELRDLWSLELTFYGYWRNFEDDTYNTNLSGAGAAILQTLRDAIHADTLQLSTSNAEITATTETVQLNVSGLDYSMWRILTDQTIGLLRVGDTSDNQVDLAVWEDRVIHYKSRNPTLVNWLAYVRDGSVTNIPAAISWSDIYNVIDARDSASLVGEATDADSIAKWIRRKKIIGSTSINTAAATELRNTELAKSKSETQSMNNLVLKRVYDVRGVEFPLCRVRAGDVLRVPDFLPQTQQLGVADLNAINTFFITETRCDHTRGELIITPDHAKKSLSSILAANNIR